MRKPFFALLALFTLAIPLAAQTNKPAPAAKAWIPPKTPWGDPDLQGQWPAVANILEPISMARGQIPEFQI